MSSDVRDRGFALVLAGPSGAGKTTIARELISRFPGDFVFSVSATTRPPRPREENGKDYDFVSAEEFERLIASEELIEWATVHGNLYGTPRRNVERAIEEGHVVVLDIDVQGAGQIRRRFEDAVLVFVLPPSPEVFWSRLSARGTEGPQELRGRILTAFEELEQGLAFDYFVVNDDLERATEVVRTIVQAETYRAERSARVAGTIRSLQAEITRLARAAGERPEVTGRPGEGAVGRGLG
jgi:guanylate kinase